MTLRFPATLTVAMLTAAASAQKFEVASVKPNHSGDQRMFIRNLPGGRFATENIPLNQLVAFAYGIRDYQISGLPAWADSDRYDIQAKAENLTPEEAAPITRMLSDAEMEDRSKKLRAMLQDLLADRFALKAHPETRQMPVYELVVAKGGSKLIEAKEDAPPLVDPPGGGGSAGEPPRVPFRAPLMRMGRGQLTGQELGIGALTMQLSILLGRTVIDKTGLTGKYDFKLTWTPDESRTATTNPDVPSESGPSLITAIQEQLGLKIEPQRGPVKIIVIDHIEKASQN
jgi:uncharacterized protein (TIGR03435 family)